MQADHILFESIEEELCCPICLEILTQPTVIGSCAHTFCYECLKPLLHIREIVCPLCRVEYTLGGAKLDGLARNRYLENIIEKMRLAGKLPPKDANSPKQAPSSSTQSNPAAPSVSRVAINTSNLDTSQLASNWSSIASDTTRSDFGRHAMDNSFNSGIFDPPSWM